MNQEFNGWNTVAKQLRIIAKNKTIELNDGQAASLLALAKRLPKNGVLIADEVGMGKTRIAAAVARSVIAAGGRVAILVPPGLGYQWGDELRDAGVDAPPILRSLDGYLNAWNENSQESKWGEYRTVILSHAFCNWSLKNNTKKNWRWALLPAVLMSLTKRNRESGCVRIGNQIKKFDDLRVSNAAEWIAKNGAKGYIERLSNNSQINIWGNNSPLFDPANYTKGTEFRKCLELVVGIGLGIFDLVIIDEAHKNRGQESNLNGLLSHVVLQATHARRLAVTATPVELDKEQWTQMLERIQVDEESKTEATTAITNYVQAVNQVRECPSNKESRDNYKKSAAAFQQALNPYLLRRDKREEQAVKEFQKFSDEPYHAYRHEKEILIDTAELTPEWKQVVCAAEALSFVTRQSDNTVAKRLHLTVCNGHGIAALIDQSQYDEKNDHKQAKADSEQAKADGVSTQNLSDNKKRLQRAEWWMDGIIQSFKDNESALFDHPAILAAIKEIESVCQQGEKVLVFGRFTRPMRALVDLLNAREMLRCVDEKRRWPQATVHKNEWPAIEAAHQQLQRPGRLNQNLLNQTLASQYQALENQRRKVRATLISNIEKGLRNRQSEPGQRVRLLFDAFKKSVADSKQDQDNDNHILAVVARALKEEVHIANALPTDFSQAFINLVEAASDCDNGDADGDDQVDKAEKTWQGLEKELTKEYSRTEGGYARLMYGETKPATRRLLQLAFNRKHGHPKVLVAQSLVGREGLNLHKACRTVVLLHPEWNPGVVEQQIGRVDRIGSLWEEKLNQAVSDGQTNGDLPRIEIRPVVFKGTYDEKNWQVLRDRWDDLRAQLHGIVISPRIAEKYADAEECIAEINAAAPNFSPMANSQ